MFPNADLTDGQNDFIFKSKTREIFCQSTLKSIDQLQSAIWHCDVDDDGGRQKEV